MSKMRVHELAKELGRANKEIIDFLTAKGIEIKSHMSMLEEEHVELVRKSVGARPAPVKREAPPKEKTEEGAAADGTARPAPPKKKNITRIFRSQNSRTGIQKPAGMRTSDDPRPARPGVRPAGNGVRPAGRPGVPARPGEGGARPMARPGSGPRPAAKPGEASARPAAKPGEMAVRSAEADTRPAAKPTETVAETKPAENVRPAAGSTAASAAKPAENVRPVAGDVRNAQQGDAKAPAHRASDAPQDKNQTQQGRPAQRDGRQQPSGTERDNRGNRDGRDGRDSRDNRGGRGPAGKDNRDGRDSRDSRDGRDNRGRGFGGRDSRDGRDGRDSRDNRGGRGFGDRDGRGQGRASGGRNLSIPQPDLGSKPVTKESRIRADKEKEKDRDKYGKRDRDRFDRQEKPQGKSQGKQNQKNGGSGKNAKTAGKFIKPVTPPPQEKKEDEVRTVTLPDRMTIRELADILKVQAAAIVKKLFLQGTMVTVNHEIEYDMAEEIALDYNCIAEHEVKVDVIEELLREEEEAEDTMVARPPVVCVMGHVDHGKTSLLDAIRNTHVIAKEAGGITQHIGAYTVQVNDQRITFLDTPGHEAFTAMRMRGANATDIAILVVAADDGVMPQTVEAISHARAAGTEIIVAINKIDKPGANIDRVKQELSEHGLIPEDWGGNTVFVPVSARTHEGLDTLLEMILLTAEVMELKANVNRKARGLDRGGAG